MAQACPLSAPLTVSDLQSGVAGETGTVWTIAPDCSFTVARRIGEKILPVHKQGRLTDEQQAALKATLDHMSAAALPPRLGGPHVNARRVIMSYGSRETVLTVASGSRARGSSAAQHDAQTETLLDLAASIKKMLGS